MIDHLKKILFTLFIMTLAIGVNSQSIVDSLHQVICDCFGEKIDLDRINDPMQLDETTKANLKACYDDPVNANMEALKAHYDLEDESEVVNELLKVQDRYFMQCETIIQLFNKVAGGKPEAAEVDIEICKEVKTGTFIHLGDEENATVIREADVEKYINAEGEVYEENKIYWKNECDYYLVYDKVDPDGFYQIGDTLKISLVNVRNDTLIYEVSFKGLSMTQEVVKVK